MVIYGKYRVVRRKLGYVGRAEEKRGSVQERTEAVVDPAGKALPESIGESP